MSRFLSLAAAGILFTTVASADMVSTSPFVPPSNGMFQTSGPMTFEAGVFPEIVMSNFRMGDLRHIAGTADCVDGICDVSFDGTIWTDITIGAAAPVAATFTNAQMSIHLYGYNTIGIPFNNSMISFTASGSVDTTPFALQMGIAGGAGSSSDLGIGLYYLTSSNEFVPQVSLDNGENWSDYSNLVYLRLNEQPTPEPATFGLLIGAAGLGFIARRRLRQQ